MGVRYSTSVVRSGLILHLDAANTKSYPGSGTTWTDLTTNGNSGTLTNGPTFSSANAGSIVFDGSNDFVSLGTYTNFGLNNKSISCWFMVVSFPSSGARRIISFPENDSASDIPAFVLSIKNSGVVETGVGGSPYASYSTVATVSTLTWVNISCVITGNVISNYYNGSLINSRTNTGNVASSPIGYFGRYNNNYGQYFPGNISNVQIYNRSLSAAEVLQNFNAFRGRYGL